MKEFIIRYPDLQWSMKVAINMDFTFIQPDGSVVTAMQILEWSVKFWDGWEHNLNSCNGDFPAAFLQNLGRQVLLLACSGFTKHGVVSAFTSKEGFPSLDGKWGIELVDMDDLEFLNSEFEVEAVVPEKFDTTDTGSADMDKPVPDYTLSGNTITFTGDIPPGVIDLNPDVNKGLFAGGEPEIPSVKKRKDKNDD